MLFKLIKLGLLLFVFAGLTGCAAKNKKKIKNPVSVEQLRRGNSDTAWLMQVLPDDLSEKLVLTPATYRNGVYVCAIENLSKPCLPKLSALVAERLEQKGILVVSDQSKAVATLYFETWFDSFSSHTNVPKAEKGVPINPTVMGKGFAAKIEQSFATGAPPDVHKRFREASDPFASVTINSNDDQKYIYAAFTAVEMEDAVDYPGENGVGASSNPWVRPPMGRKAWMKERASPPKRSLIGSYNGEIPTEKAVLPMLRDAIDLLIIRAGQAPRKK